MLTLTRATFLQEPYPIGVAAEVFPEAVYRGLVEAYPAEAAFIHMTGVYDKFSLSEVNNPKAYLKFVGSSAIWAAFYSYVKGAEFPRAVARLLKEHGLKPFAAGTYRSRFEFSSLPAAGGLIWPHTDIASKVVTLIIPMMRPGEWDKTWGGGTDVLVPKLGVTPEDYKTPREQFDCPASFPCDPNQAVVFIKSDHSWHSVGPIQGPAGRWRRTLTINIERGR